MKRVSEIVKKSKLSRGQLALLAAGLLGLLLLGVSSLPGGASKKAAGGTANARIELDLTSYEKQLEQRLGGIIGGIAGAGETRVMLTLDSGSEPIYATQGKTDQKSSAGDGSQTDSLSAEKQYVIVGSGSGAQGLVLKMLEPQVRGVAVVCQGGGDLLVRQAVVEAVTAVLGVGSNKVSVARLATNN